MKALIIQAHPEPRSYSAALATTAAEALGAAGHEVELHDLYADDFDPVSDRRNFRTVADPDYFKQQAEEAHASKHDGFVPELDAYMTSVEASDLLVLSFPLWWFGMPAILKGWVDRVFAAGRMYGGRKLYENGIGRGEARGLILMTTGGGEDAFGGRGVNPSLETIIAPIQHGVFWFNGFLPLDPFLAWAPARISDDERARRLTQLAHRLTSIFEETPRTLPPLADFPEFGLDTQHLFMAVASRPNPPDEAYRALVPAELEALEDLKRDGVVLSAQLAAQEAPDWRGFLTFRAPDAATVRAHLETLPLASYLTFEVTKLAP